VNSHLSWCRRLLSLVVAAMPLACASWQRVAVPVDTVLAERQQVQVWRGSRARVLHAVRVTSDSVVGVPFQQRLSCDSCRVAVPRAEVDSLRFGNQEAPGVFFSILPFVALVVLLATLRGPLFS
jgi:hypothetical protein